MRPSLPLGMAGFSLPTGEQDGAGARRELLRLVELAYLPEPAATIASMTERSSADRRASDSLSPMRS